ncbi:MAG: hypothetical protein V4507_02095, partial [Verrucomicrobiota bacterium]
MRFLKNVPDYLVIFSSPIMMPKQIKIIGGGLAGLTLGIALRQKEIPVVIYEASTYPRHRVCGEFISGSGQDSLKRLGLDTLFHRAGISIGKTVAFYEKKRLIPTTPLPEQAWCISRFVTDEILSAEFQRLGGELRLEERWTQDYEEGIVRATGRRVEISSEGPRLFGLKVHAKNIHLDADLEMHFQQNGYVGLCRLPHEEVNICGLFQSQTAVPHLIKTWKNYLGGEKGTPLYEKLKEATWDENSFCAVAGISLRPIQAIEREECCIGDALTMIPPVSGNGMSMAFESAEIAFNPLVHYSQGQLTWSEAQQKIARQCDQTFSRRLRWASHLQKLLF